jgi:hypothetical protein
MERKIFKTTGWGALALIAVMSAAWQGQAQDAKASYSSMASIDQYLMTDRNADAHYLQEDGDGIGGIIQSSDDRQHQGRIR